MLTESLLQRRATKITSAISPPTKKTENLMPLNPLDPAIVGGVVAALVTGVFQIGVLFDQVRNERRQAARERKFQKEFDTDIFHAEGIIDTERLIDEEVLALYGIDLSEADKDRGITHGRIRYVVAIVNAQNVRFGRMESGETNAERLKKRLREMFQGDEDYMPNFFRNKLSREVWKHARQCFRKILRDNIDLYLENTYDMSFTPPEQWVRQK